MTEVQSPAQPAANVQGAIDAAALGQSIAAGITSGVASAMQTLVSQMAAFTTSANEITNKLNAIQQNLTSTVNQADITTTANVTGAHDPYDSIRDAHIVTHRLSTSMAENADAMMKEYLKYTAGVWARSLDHFCSVNPEVPPKTAKPS